MYIGRLGDGSHPEDGIYVMFKEVVDNAIDEFIMGHGNRIVIRLEDGLCSVRDYGRGIPLGKLVECVSEINTGAKYNDDVFQFSVGLNGIGTKAVNALSSDFRVVTQRDGRFREARFARGELVGEKEGETRSRNGTLVEFTPDPEIFGSYAFRYEYLARRLWHYAYLNSGLKLVFNGETFQSESGLRDLLFEEVGESGLYEIVHFREKMLEFALVHTNEYGERYFSFANGQHTTAGGAHLSAFKEGIVKALNEFTSKSYSGDVVREGMIGAISIRLKDPVFESQTKTRLGNSEIRGWVSGAVRQALEQHMHRYPEFAKTLVAKVESNQKLRTELQSVKKQARERAKQIALRIPNLKDCKIHLGDDDRRAEESTVFITEGQSAAGSMISSRDVRTQAVFALRGKPLNVFGHRQATVYRNEEIYNLMQALGIEGGIEGLRYNRVVLATDADVDGLHIRNLLLTLFLHFFESLVLDNHLFILETPLFRARDKKRTVYCYSEEEKRKALDSFGGRAEVTRFKGLGEISPGEFGRFIGEKMRLQSVSITHLKEVPDMLEFFMGRNTPERKQFIIDNLA
ncbi:type IIA DNA topoisomerase subunit B [Candidatus Fermentibacterales bacterium]|nr:type IIA DNA topoisomerase subunit B [Candidatus Fermentibacterales bacterium]